MTYAQALAVAYNRNLNGIRANALSALGGHRDHASTIFRALQDADSQPMESGDWRRSGIRGWDVSDEGFAMMVVASHVARDPSV